jgi:ferredoxin
MRVEVDMDLCQSNGLCQAAAPDVFELGDDDILRWVEEPGEERRAEIEEAAAACPVQAITVID